MNLGDLGGCGRAVQAENPYGEGEFSHLDLNVGGFSSIPRGTCWRKSVRVVRERVSLGLVALNAYLYRGGVS